MCVKSFCPRPSTNHHLQDNIFSLVFSLRSFFFIFYFYYKLSTSFALWLRKSQLPSRPALLRPIIPCAVENDAEVKNYSNKCLPVSSSAAQTSDTRLCQILSPAGILNSSSSSRRRRRQFHLITLDFFFPLRVLYHREIREAGGLFMCPPLLFHLSPPPSHFSSASPYPRQFTHLLVCLICFELFILFCLCLSTFLSDA